MSKDPTLEVILEYGDGVRMHLLIAEVNWLQCPERCCIIVKPPAYYIRKEKEAKDATKKDD